MSSLSSYRLFSSVLTTILIIAAPSSAIASRIDDDSLTDKASDGPAGTLPSTDQAGNDSQAANPTVAETDPIPTKPVFEVRDDLATSTLQPFLEIRSDSTPLARPTKCVLVGGSFCTALRDRLILSLTAAQAAMSIADGVTTMEFVKRGYVEVDPISRLLLGRTPSWSRMAPVGAVQVIGSMWLAGRMRTSSHEWVRRTWWVPQILQIGASAFGTVNNRKLIR